MAHDHHHHHHGPGQHHDHGGGQASLTRLSWALALLLGFMLVQAIGGWLAHSLALLSEALHMAADAASLALAVLAQWMLKRPAAARLSYGWQRGPALAAFVNGLALLALTAWVAVEALLRLRSPQPVLALPMLVIAVGGAVANVIAFWVLSGGASINERSARAHVLGDLLGSAAAVGAALTILASGWNQADPLLSLLVSALIARAGWRVTAESGHLLLEGAPLGFDPAQVAPELADLDGLLDVHHVHAWSLSGEQILLTLHARMLPDADDQALLGAITERLQQRLGVAHATIQLERGPCSEDACRLRHTHESLSNTFQQ